MEEKINENDIQKEPISDGKATVIVLIIAVIAIIAGIIAYYVVTEIDDKESKQEAQQSINEVQYESEETHYIKYFEYKENSLYTKEEDKNLTDIEDEQLAVSKVSTETEITKIAHSYMPAPGFASEYILLKDGTLIEYTGDCYEEGKDVLNCTTVLNTDNKKVKDLLYLQTYSLENYEMPFLNYAQTEDGSYYSLPDKDTKLVPNINEVIIAGAEGIDIYYDGRVSVNNKIVEGLKAKYLFRESKDESNIELETPIVYLIDDKNVLYVVENNELKTIGNIKDIEIVTNEENSDKTYIINIDNKIKYTFNPELKYI